MKTATQILKIAAAVADEALTIAADRGLTLDEVLAVPDVMKNKIINEMRVQEIPYKRQTPEENSTGVE